MTAPACPSVIITGASDGIGRALALAFARRGCSLGLLARREPLLTTLAEECRREAKARGFNITVHVAPCDVTNHGAQRSALTRLDEALGGAEHFIANAGVNGEDSERIFAVNVTGAVVGIEHMGARMAARGGGHITGVGSIAAYRGLPKSAPYCASKAALHTYLESYRLDGRVKGVGVSIVAPGFIATDMTKGYDSTMPFLMGADAAGERFATAILRRRPLIIAPRPYWLVYLFFKHMPDWVYRRVVGPLIAPMKN